MRIDDASGTSAHRPVSVTPPSTPPASTTSSTSKPQSTSAMVQQATPQGATRPDVQQLAVATKAASAANPEAAMLINAELATMLTPVEYGEYMRAADKLEKGTDRRDIDGNGKVSGSEAVATLRADLLKACGLDVPIGHLHLDDADYKGIPQGQGYDGKTNEFLTTYYAKTADGEGTDVRLSIQDKATGYETAYVKLKGPNGAELGHGGGVAISGNWVLVSDGGKVYSYDRAKIAAAKPGDEIEPHVIIADVPKHSDIFAVTDTKVGSFMNVSPDGKYAYVGEFAQDVPGKDDNESQAGFMYRFEIDQKTGMLINQSGPQLIPDNAQGVAVTDKGLIFTTSYSNNPDWSPKELHFLKFETDPSKGFKLENPSGATVIGEIDYYAEGLNVIGNDLYITYESGAAAYEGKDGHQSIRKYSLDDFSLGSR